MRKMVILLAAVMVLLSAGLTEAADEKQFDLLYFGKNGDEYMYQVTARRTDTIKEVMRGQEVGYEGYGNAIAYAVQQIAKNHVIKNVIPIIYARSAGSTYATAYTKQVIIFAIPKDAGK